MWDGDFSLENTGFTLIVRSKPTVWDGDLSREGAIMLSVKELVLSPLGGMVTTLPLRTTPPAELDVLSPLGGMVTWPFDTSLCLGE